MAFNSDTNEPGLENYSIGQGKQLWKILVRSEISKVVFQGMMVHVWTSKRTRYLTGWGFQPSVPAVLVACKRIWSSASYGINKGGLSAASWHRFLHVRLDAGSLASVCRFIKPLGNEYIEHFKEIAKKIFDVRDPLETSFAPNGRITNQKLESLGRRKGYLTNPVINQVYRILPT